VSHLISPVLRTLAANSSRFDMWFRDVCADRQRTRCHRGRGTRPNNRQRVHPSPALVATVVRG
jgi:hypothetical protein